MEERSKVTFKVVIALLLLLGFSASLSYYNYKQSAIVKELTEDSLECPSDTLVLDSVTVDSVN